ncbi:MAG: hypothetical protein Q8Q37_02215 [bacterium]|nr:hypothetical protein [bacterium]
MLNLKDALQGLANTIIRDHRSGKPVVVSLAEAFERSRRDIGASYQIGNELREEVKKGLVALKNGEDLTDIILKIQELWTRLGDLNLPKDLAWRFDAENGQEMVEFLFVMKLYQFLDHNNNGDLPQLLSAEEIGVTPQAWLTGIGDAITELGKMHIDALTDENLEFREVISRRRRYLNMAREIYDFLNQYESCYAQVIDNNRFRGFGNGFRGLLFRISRVIESETHDLALLIDVMKASDHHSGKD